MMHDRISCIIHSLHASKVMFLWFMLWRGLHVKVDFCNVPNMDTNIRDTKRKKGYLNIDTQMVIFGLYVTILFTIFLLSTFVVSIWEWIRTAEISEKEAQRKVLFRWTQQQVLTAPVSRMQKEKSEGMREKGKGGRKVKFHFYFAHCPLGRLDLAWNNKRILVKH